MSVCANDASWRRCPPSPTSWRGVESRLAGHGRLLVRYSGTEPLLRIMLEGRDRAEIAELGGRDRQVGNVALASARQLAE